MSLFRPIITGVDVEDAVVATLQHWIEVYVREFEDQRSLAPETIPLPRSWQVVTDLDNMPEDQLPSVLVLSPGLAEEPTHDGEGNYDACYRIGVFVLVAAKDWESTNRLAKWYGAIVRTLLLQKASLRGFASGLVWEDEDFDEIPLERNRTLHAAQELFRVEVANVSNLLGGPGMSVPDEDIELDEGDPSDPDAQPGSNWWTVNEAAVSVDRKEE